MQVRPGREVRWLRMAGWALLLPPLFYLLSVHWAVLAHPLAHEGTEAAVAMSAELLARGGDPTGAGAFLRDLPYGFVHAQVAALAEPALAGSISFHRTLAAFYILATLGMLGAWAWSKGCDRWAGAAALLCVYAGLLFSTTAHGRPDALCVALMVGAVLAANAPGPRWAWFVAGVLGVLAFYTKIYGLAGLLTGGLIIAAKRRWAAALWWCLGAIVSAAACHAWALFRFENYYLVTLGVTQYSWSWQAGHLAWQSWLFFLQTWMLGLAAVLGLMERERWPLAPALALPWLASLAYLAFLGGHLGAVLTYFFQLSLPWLALAAAWMPRSGWRRGLAGACLLLGAYRGCWALEQMQAWRPAGFELMLSTVQPIFAQSKPGEVLAGAEYQPWVRRYGQVQADNDHLRFFVDPQRALLGPDEQAALAGLFTQVDAGIVQLQQGLKVGRFQWVLLNSESPVLKGADLRRYEVVADKPYRSPGHPFPYPYHMLWLRRRT